MAHTPGVSSSASPLPPYAVRVSARSRRVRLVIAPGKGLTVVTPPGFDHALVADIVRDRLDWVTRHLERLADAVPAAPAAPAEPPARVELRAVERVLAVRYRPSGAGSGTVRLKGCGLAGLEVSGDIARRDLVGEGLRTWLKREASLHLPSWLDAEAHRMGLKHSGVTIRLQRTRWGSCSAKGCISLNARLLFLPRELAAYVLAHELAHTVHLNHSDKYWRFLGSICPHALALDRELRTARRYVPEWALG